MSDMRDRQFLLKLTDEELELLKKVASYLGLSASDYIRRVAVDPARHIDFDNQTNRTDIRLVLSSSAENTARMIGRFTSGAGDDK